MAVLTVSTDTLESERAAEYFTRADRRVMIGLRAALEILGLPVPAYAVRHVPGRTPARDVTAAYAADNPTPFSTVLAERKPNASPERIAAVQAAKAPPHGRPSNLYDQVFSG
jgi:hypothetical protein